MASFQIYRRRSLLLVSLLSVASIDVSHAMQQRFDPPTPSPSVSSVPSVSTQPTAPLPTTSPTTNAPSAAPSDRPPTVSPAPSSRPSNNPMLSATITLPSIELNFIITELRRRLLDVNELQLISLLEAFFHNFFLANANYNKSFRSLDITTALAYDAPSGEVNAELNGAAVYEGAEVPTEAELNDILAAFFGHFGVATLEEYLIEQYPDFVTSDMKVAIDGKSVFNAMEEPNDDDDGISSGLVGGLVAAGVVVLAAGTLLVRRRRRNSLDDDDERKRVVADDHSSTINNQVARIGAKPRKLFPLPRSIRLDSPPPPLPPVVDQSILSNEQADVRSFSGMSLEESLFTAGNESFVKKPLSYRYDPTRMDQDSSTDKGSAKESNKDDDFSVDGDATIYTL
jgi:hypothetical protein